MVVIQTLCINLTLLCHICWRVVYRVWHMADFQLLCVNHDGCHTWDRKCSLFQVHLIHIHSLYIHHRMCYVIGPCLQINDFGSLAWISLTALSQTYLIISYRSKPSRHKQPMLLSWRHFMLVYSAAIWVINQSKNIYQNAQPVLHCA